MDPEACLDDLRNRIADYEHYLSLRQDGGGEVDGGFEELQELAHLADRIVESFEALDEWLTCGGFLPPIWEGGRKPRGKAADKDELPAKPAAKPAARPARRTKKK